MAEDFQPFDFQKRGTQHLLDNPYAALFATMGTGKTVMTLTAIAEMILEGRAKGALIIGPIRTLSTAWPIQAKRWKHLSWLRVANMRTKEGQKAWEDGSADIYMTGPEVLPTITRNLKCRTCKGVGCESCGNGFVEHVTPGFVDRFIRKRKTLPVDILVVDELSQAKSHSSKRFNAIRPYLHDRKLTQDKKFVSPFRRVIGLTGTPAPSGYLNLFAQIRLLDGGKRFGTAFTSFRDRYFTSDFMGFRFDIKPGAKEEIDAKIADIALVMLGSDYLKIPPCTYENIEIDLPAPAMKAYRALEKDSLVDLSKLLKGFKEGDEVMAKSAAALIGKLSQCCTGLTYNDQREVFELHSAKIEALRKLRKQHAGEPILLMVAYRHERTRVLREFPDAVDFDEKKIPDWIAGKIPLFVCNPANMGHGTDTLQFGGRIIVWMTLTWNSELYDQGNGRLIRMGQESETLIYHFLASDTVDWAILESLKNKADMQSSLMRSLKTLQSMRQ